MAAATGGGGCCGGGGGTPRSDSTSQSGAAIDRRSFLGASGAALVAATTGVPFAGPFRRQDGFPIPADKRLDPAWLRSLTERGVGETVAGDALGTVGMPVGGLFAGTVYLGGDGRLWNWDIFNVHHEGAVVPDAATSDPVTYRGRPLRERDGANYVEPPEPDGPFAFGVELRVGGRTWTMDARGWADVRFRGEYPVGTVRYADPESPLRVTLEAFSPFVPLDVESSSFPATVLRYTLHGDGDEPVTAELAARFENPVLLGQQAVGHQRHTEVRSGRGAARVVGLARPVAADDRPVRADLLFDDFESGTYDRWTVRGTAFGDRPRHLDDIADYQGELGAEGQHLVNSHQTRGGEDVVAGDRHTGELLSEPFQIERHFVHFRIGGGAHAGKTCVDLLVGGEVVRTAIGRNDNLMQVASFDVAELAGREARLRIVDAERGGWGNVGVDEIVFSDLPRAAVEPERMPGFGSFCVSCPGGAEGQIAHAATDAGELAEVGRQVVVPPGGSVTVTLLVGWHFPNLAIPGMPGRRRWYASRWNDALAVVVDLEERLAELTASTFGWRATWYDSTLPHWLLDRSLIPVDALATNTCHRFEDGRYWFWEGVGCCPGTCTHVWGYAQAIGRLFPQIERALREDIDYGLAFHPGTGAIDYRAEFGRHVAHDGQCGCILRACREHRQSPDDGFLRRLWPRIRRSAEYLLGQDPDRDGLLEGAQYNTLDAAWYGPMGWLSSLYVAALAAAASMARDVGDDEFAVRCEAVVARGREALVEELFDGEYFIHRPDPAHPEANATGPGCHIDQVYGQAWAHQAGLGRVVPAAASRSALRSLWKYNFAPDVGVYRDWMKVIAGGRWYAVHGEAGLLMCTFPKGGADRAAGAGRSAWAAQYMNECMTGFEYQVAAHMLWEGLVTEGLAVTRAIHDRYAPARRNPYNEIECSDHYGRAMAAYGVFVAACGWSYHGPQGALSLAPRVGKDDFRAAFTAAAGWGTIGQRREGAMQSAWVELRHGELQIAELSVEVLDGVLAGAARAELRRAGSGASEALRVSVQRQGAGCRLRLAAPQELRAGDRLEFRLQPA